MQYITIDGDDVGQKISFCYLSDDVQSLSTVNFTIDRKTQQIKETLESHGFEVVFCAADGVTGFHETKAYPPAILYSFIEDIAGSELSFSAGVGETLREAYVALLFAKSKGKARICEYKDMK